MRTTDFDTKTLSTYIGYDRYHIYVLIRKHDLPYYKDENGLTRFKKKDVDEWLLNYEKRNYNEKVKVNCAGCGEEFQIHHYRTITAKNNYCSRKCRITKKQLPCDWCGKIIERVPAQLEPHNFCSRECSGKYYTKNYSGENNKNWTGDYVKYYGPNWRHQRNLARERDSYKCTKCGKPEIDKQHDVHHVIAFALFGIDKYEEANELTNLITLCNSCHTSLEERYKKAIDKRSRPKSVTVVK